MENGDIQYRNDRGAVKRFARSISAMAEELTPAEKQRYDRVMKAKRKTSKTEQSSKLPDLKPKKDTRGGKASFRDFHFTQKINKSSPKL